MLEIKYSLIVDERKRSLSFLFLKHKSQREEKKREKEKEMGGILSSVFGGDAASAITESESEPSRVHKFSSSARWQLHFNELKDSNKLVSSSIQFDFNSIQLGFLFH